MNWITTNGTENVPRPDTDRTIYMTGTVSVTVLVWLVDREDYTRGIFNYNTGNWELDEGGIEPPPNVSHYCEITPPGGVSDVQGYSPQQQEREARAQALGGMKTYRKPHPMLANFGGELFDVSGPLVEEMEKNVGRTVRLRNGSIEKDGPRGVELGVIQCVQKDYRGALCYRIIFEGDAHSFGSAWLPERVEFL